MTPHQQQHAACEALLRRLRAERLALAALAERVWALFGACDEVALVAHAPGTPGYALRFEHASIAAPGNTIVAGDLTVEVRPLDRVLLALEHSGHDAVARTVDDTKIKRLECWVFGRCPSGWVALTVELPARPPCPLCQAAGGDRAEA